MNCLEFICGLTVTLLVDYKLKVVKGSQIHGKAAIKSSLRKKPNGMTDWKKPLKVNKFDILK